MKNNISKADMIFISVNTPTKTKGKGAGQAIDLNGLNHLLEQFHFMQREELS